MKTTVLSQQQTQELNLLVKASIVYQSPAEAAHRILSFFEENSFNEDQRQRGVDQILELDLTYKEDLVVHLLKENAYYWNGSFQSLDMLPIFFYMEGVLKSPVKYQLSVNSLDVLQDFVRKNSSLSSEAKASWREHIEEALDNILTEK